MSTSQWKMLSSFRPTLIPSGGALAISAEAQARWRGGGRAAGGGAFPQRSRRGWGRRA
jgi:hypothetical protein